MWDREALAVWYTLEIDLMPSFVHHCFFKPYDVHWLTGWRTRQNGRSGPLFRFHLHCFFFVCKVYRKWIAYPSLIFKASLVCKKVFVTTVVRTVGYPDQNHVKICHHHSVQPAAPPPLRSRSTWSGTRIWRTRTRTTPRCSELWHGQLMMQTSRLRDMSPLMSIS